jgi:hypothetical protein
MYALCFDNVPRKSMSIDSQLKAEPIAQTFII